MNGDPWSTALDRCLDNAYGEPESYFDLHGNEFRHHGRRAQAGKIGPVNRAPKPSRPVVTAYEGYDGPIDAFFTNDGVTWLNCKTFEEWK